MSAPNLSMKTVRLRFVEESDAEFILSLRLNQKLNIYLSPVSPDVQKQVEWIRNYKNDEARKQQFYFMIERLDGVRCGTVRVYDLTDDSFSWGSRILNEEKTRFAAIESAFLVYQFGFESLGYIQSHFEVKKGNAGVLRFHERMGAQRVREDDEFYYYTITKADVEAKRAGLEGVIS